jgi:hypothetical protein
MGRVLHIPRHPLFVSARVNNFLLCGRFEVVTVKRMGEVSRAKRFELITRKMLSYKI